MSEDMGTAPLFPGEAAVRLDTMTNQDAQQWQQVLARDARADGAFVYAVRTTGIFCRPSCPSRRPAERNVTFFATPSGARAAGFRACLRCEPERAGAARGELVARAAAGVLTEGVDRRVTLEDLARATGTGRLSVLRGFREVLGVTPREFVRARKVAKFTEVLEREQEQEIASVKDSPARRTAPSITAAIYEAGFGSSSRLYEQSGETLGMTPRAMLRGAAGKVIRYATAESPFGRMLAAATDGGVCAILFGRDDHELLADLRRRFGRAELIPARGDTGWLAEALAYVASQTTEHPAAATFPLDVRATAFQLRVWKALREIPRGGTRSYSDVAQQIGRPRAVRAVAAAVGANPVAVAVPCHRVLGKDGSMRGYRWGVERKIRLLAAESSKAPSSGSNPAQSSDHER